MKTTNALIALAVFAGVYQTTATTIFPIATNPAVVEISGGIASSGTNYLVSILSGTNVCTQLLSTNGTLITLLATNGHSMGSASFTGGSSSGAKFPCVAFAGTNYLQVWYDTYATKGYGQIIHANGNLSGSPFLLASSTNMVPEALASDHTNFLVILEDYNRNFYGQLATSSGTLSGSAFLISSQVANGEAAAVTFGETNYLAIWSSQNVANNGNMNLFFGAFVSQNGAVSTPFQIGVSPAPDWGFCGVAFDGTNYLAAWQWDPEPETFQNVTNWEIFGRLISQTGTFPGNEVQLVTEPGNDQIPTLAFDGSDYLLAWSHGLNVTTNTQTHFQFLDRTASPVDSEFSVFAAQSTNTPAITFDGLLFDGTRYVVADTFTRPNTLGGEVFGAFLSRLAILTVSNYAGNQFSLTLNGSPGFGYAIQMTTNLSLTNWTAIVTNTATNGVFIFTDAHATNQSRFYRAAVQ